MSQQGNSKELTISKHSIQVIQKVGEVGRVLIDVFNTKENRAMKGCLIVNILLKSNGSSICI